MKDEKPLSKNFFHGEFGHGHVPSLIAHLVKDGRLKPLSSGKKYRTDRSTTINVAAWPVSDLPTLQIGSRNPFSQKPVLHKDWSLRSQQACIDELQTALVKKGFLKTAGGKFDEDTQLAVKVFQRCRGIQPDGIVGQLTWAALLFPILQRTDAVLPEIQDEVKTLQRVLRKEHLNVVVDGFFGPRTERAVKQFQKRYKIHPDGVCGYLTWSLLIGQKTEWIPSRKYRSLYFSFVEQLLIVAAVAIGVHVGHSEGKVAYSAVSLLVISYSLSCVAQPIISKLPIERLMNSGRSLRRFVPLIRFAPYVLTGLFWQHILRGLQAIL
ncbi:MAG: peptidoglycan-binding protein [Phormidesmis sp.]